MLCWLVLVVVQDGRFRIICQYFIFESISHQNQAKARPEACVRITLLCWCADVPPNIIENATNSRSTITRESPSLCAESLINEKVPYNARSNYWLDIEPALGAWQHVVPSRKNRGSSSQQGIRCAAAANPSPNKFSPASLVLIKVYSASFVPPQTDDRRTDDQSLACHATNNCGTTFQFSSLSARSEPH